MSEHTNGLMQIRKGCKHAHIISADASFQWADDIDTTVSFNQIDYSIILHEQGRIKEKGVQLKIREMKC